MEDRCEAFGATVGGQGVGTFGDVAILSFYPAHHITMGEGGAVFTSSPLLARIAESSRDWGRDCYCKPGHDHTCNKRFDWRLGDLPKGYDHKYTYSHVGYNLKVSDMQAALGVSRLKKLDRFIERQRENFAGLMQRLLARGLDRWYRLPVPTPGTEPSWFGYLLTIRDGAGIGRNAAPGAVASLRHNGLSLPTRKRTPGEKIRPALGRSSKERLSEHPVPFHRP